MLLGARTMTVDRISPRLARLVARAAMCARAQPVSRGLDYSCGRLLREAAVGLPLCRDAAATVLSIASDVLVEARRAEYERAAA